MSTAGMGQLDIGWAIGQLEVFVAMSQPMGRSRTGQIIPGAGATYEDVLGQGVVTDAILDRVSPRWRAPHAASGADPWAYQREACVRALSLLRRQTELVTKLGDSAPVLSAGSLHPWVWAGAGSLWASGHYAEALAAAARQVNAGTQHKVDRRDVSEADLVNQCFSDDAPSPGRPRLRLPGDDGGRSARSVRRGIRAYAEGCYAALRNPAAHDVQTELPEAEALEQLVAFSVLARWVERATKVTAP